MNALHASRRLAGFCGAAAGLFLISHCALSCGAADLLLPVGDSEPEPGAVPGIRLYGARLRGEDLRSRRLVEADLRVADLRGADLRRVDLSGALLSGARLRDADLRGADLSRCPLRGVRLWGARYDRHTRWPAHYHPELAGAVYVSSPGDESFVARRLPVLRA